jgi:hypothetical protein
VIVGLNYPFILGPFILGPFILGPFILGPFILGSKPFDHASLFQNFETMRAIGLIQTIRSEATPSAVRQCDGKSSSRQADW